MKPIVCVTAQVMGTKDIDAGEDSGFLECFIIVCASNRHALIYVLHVL